MMNRACDESGSIQAKLEGNKEKTSKSSKEIGFISSSTAAAVTTTTTSRQWSGFKNPRIVRVSRTFGGKDRHSKVCTVRGLRDRRIRLSVPTAVQLYDLQDKLGLSQPSKVVDWLLDATKVDIDELPPLQFPPGDFAQFHPQTLIGQLANPGAPHHHHLNSFLDANLTLMKDGPTRPSSNFSAMLPGREGININADLDDEEDIDDGKSIDANLERIKWNTRSSNDQEDHVTAQSFFPLGGSGGFVPNLMHWDPSGLSLSQFGNHGSLVPHHEPNLRDYSSNHHMLFGPPMGATTSLFHDNRFHPSTASGYPFHPSGSGSKPLVIHELHSSEEGNRNQKSKGDSVTEL